MRYIRYVFLLALAICLITVALANRTPVTVGLLPDEMAAVVGLGLTLQVPLFIVIFAGIAAGLLIGFFWEYVREHKHRAAATQGKAQVAKLEREVSRLKDRKAEGKDDVLALLEDSAGAR
jgi:uncharacterized integral membrane protein